MSSLQMDIHRPSSPQFDPEAYTLLGVLNLRPDEDDPSAGPDLTHLNNALEALGHPPFPKGKQEGRCDHCGQRIRYAAFLYHMPTHTIITVGEDCLDNRFTDMTAEAFQRLRKGIQRRSRHQAHLEEAMAFNPKLAVLGDYQEAIKINTFVADLAEKIRRYPLSERQMQAAVESIERHERWQAEREEQRRNSVPAPVGKQEVVGEVRRIKTQDTPFGITEKMVVRDDRGFTVWCTVPKAILDHVEEGQRVTFVAHLSRSEDDETFAFGSRPHRARVLEG